MRMFLWASATEGKISWLFLQDGDNKRRRKKKLNWIMLAVKIFGY